jgi:ribonuclease HI
MAMRANVKLFFDGGCRPNPGRMETAVVVRGRSYVQRDMGHGTSLDAEWRALIEAVKLAQEFGLADPVFLGDSLAVIGQVSGAARSAGSSARHHHALRALAAPWAPLPVRHVKRTQNLAGIALARLHDRSDRAP